MFDWLDRLWDYEEHDREDAPQFFGVLEHLPPVTSLQLYYPTARGFVEDPSEPLSAKIFISQTVLSGLTSFTALCDWEGPHVVRMMQYATNVEDLTIGSDSRNGPQLLSRTSP
jgi:hypothetical protein